MPHPLEGPREKLRRAEEHIDTLASQIARFLDLKPYTAAQEVDPRTGHQIWRMKVRTNSPVRLGVIVGDVIHNLRSSLDNLAWQLALTIHPVPSRKTAFPIHREPDKVTKGLTEAGRDAIRDLPEEAKEIVESIQPYRGGDTGRLLLALHRLSITDKHQIIVRPFATFRGVMIAGDSLERATDEAHFFMRSTPGCNDGDILICLNSSILADLGENYEVDAHFDVALDFPEGFAALTAVGFMRRIHQTIRDEVFPLFEKFFERPTSLT